MAPRRRAGRRMRGRNEIALARMASLRYGNGATPMLVFVQQLWDVTVALAPWLLLGAALAGVLHVVLPPGFVHRHLRGRAGVWKAVAIGVPLPLCSCGVIPAAMGLRRDGASRGASIGFLVATPQTGVDSVLVSASMLGLPFALWKVVTALVTGVVAGTLVDRFDHGHDDARPQDAGEAGPPRRGVAAVVHHGLEIVQTIWRWIVIGVVVSAAIGTWVPPASLAAVASLPAWVVVLATLAIAVPLYVCATASVPIAAALVAGGFPPGAALVLLMAGPATNVATLGAVARGFGGRALAIYLGTIVVGAVAFAWAFDALLGAATIAHVHAHLHDEGAWWQQLAGAALVLLLASFAVTDLRRALARRAASAVPPSTPSVDVTVVGMNCEGCVAHLEETLRAAPGVRACEVTLVPPRAVVHGDVDLAAVRALVSKAGYSVPGGDRADALPSAP